MCRSCRASFAFTLVELLIVVGIIAMLIGILLPAIMGAKLAAGQIKCVANVRSLATAIRAYTVDNRDCLPRAHSQMWPIGDTAAGYPGYNFTGKVPDPPRGSVGKPLAGMWPENWTGLTLPYLGFDGKVWECPLRSFTSESSFTYTTRGKSVSTRLSYLVNGCAVASGADFMSMPFGPVFEHPVGSGPWDMKDQGKTFKTGKVAADTIMLVDSVRGSNGGEESMFLFENSPNVANYVDIFNVTVSSHQGRSATVAYFNSSVETVSTDRLLGESRFYIARRATAKDIEDAKAQSGRDLIIDISTGHPRGVWTAAKDD